ncbi:MAG: hypothetical protein ACYDHX_07960 [Methanothrix sp.]
MIELCVLIPSPCVMTYATGSPFFQAIRPSLAIGLLDQGRSSMTPAAALEIAFDTFWLMKTNLHRRY